MKGTWLWTPMAFPPLLTALAIVTLMPSFLFSGFLFPIFTMP
ncbi:MAG: hypothetical protein AB1651_12035 [Pseudomonadota bacterium]|jgi:hypothetical protein